MTSFLYLVALGELSLCLRTHVCGCQKPEEGARSPGAGIEGSCEPPEVGAGS